LQNNIISKSITIYAAINLNVLNRYNQINIVLRNGNFYRQIQILPYKNREKKWHRSVKLDIYFCPFFKNAYKSLQQYPSKNTLLPFCFEFGNFLENMTAYFFNIYYAENDLGRFLVVYYTTNYNGYVPYYPNVICL
jgi:hypothetical protein